MKLKKTIAMSSLQCSYMIEREVELGGIGVACHAYIEFKATENINLDLLIKSWGTLFMVHPLMGAFCSEYGVLEIKENRSSNNGNNYAIWDEKYCNIEFIREKYSKNSLNVKNGENAKLHILSKKGLVTYIVFEFDLTAFDILSFMIIIRDLSDIYLNLREYKSYNIRETEYLDESKFKYLNSRENKEYWIERLFNGDIKLPLKTKLKIENVKEHEYVCINKVINSRKYNLLKKIKDKYNIELEELLLIIFCYVFLNYKKTSSIYINYIYTNRIEKEINTVADFTSNLIYKCDIDYRPSLDEFIIKAREKIRDDKKHSQFDGVAVQRLIKQKGRNNEKYLIPIVFSPALKIPLISKEFKNCFGDLEYIISQTPGVLLDAQTYVIEEKLFITWVFLKNCVYESEIDLLLNKYVETIDSLIDSSIV